MRYHKSHVIPPCVLSGLIGSNVHIGSLLKFATNVVFIWKPRDKTEIVDLLSVVFCYVHLLVQLCCTF